MGQDLVITACTGVCVCFVAKNLLLKFVSSSFLPSENLLCHSNTEALDKMFPPYVSRDKLNVSKAVLLKLHKKFDVNSLLNLFYQA